MLSGAVGVAAAVGPSALAQSPGGLTDITGDAKPITVAERLARVAKAQRLMRELGVDALLVETDAPYLAPIPKRGKRNEPAYVAHTTRHIAELRGVDPETLAEVTYQNAVRLFGIQE